MNDTIAEVIAAHERDRCWWRCEGGTSMTDDQHNAHVADAIRAALGLTQEWAHMGRPWPDEDERLDEWSCGHPIIAPARYGVVHEGYDRPVSRLVSEWKPVDA